MEFGRSSCSMSLDHHPHPKKHQQQQQHHVNRCILSRADNENGATATQIGGRQDSLGKTTVMGAGMLSFFGPRGVRAHIPYLSHNFDSLRLALVALALRMDWMSLLTLSSSLVPEALDLVGACSNPTCVPIPRQQDLTLTTCAWRWWPLP